MIRGQELPRTNKLRTKSGTFKSVTSTSAEDKHGRKSMVGVDGGPPMVREDRRKL